ncbi:unnamed protein product [Linum trigynum]|uniref:Uncharacterized protein n=1 Tax=Linum trigynum TaxID=586398 RepID=A0AAV2GUY9_9ROSI
MDRALEEDEVSTRETSLSFLLLSHCPKLGMTTLIEHHHIYQEGSMTVWPWYDKETMQVGLCQATPRSLVEISHETHGRCKPLPPQLRARPGCQFLLQPSFLLQNVVSFLGKDQELFLLHFVILHNFFPHPFSLFSFQHGLESKSSCKVLNKINLHLLTHARLFNARCGMWKGEICHKWTCLIIIITRAHCDNFILLHNVLVAFFILLFFLYGSIKVILNKLCTSLINDLYVLLHALEGLLCFKEKGEVNLGNGVDMKVHLGA